MEIFYVEIFFLLNHLADMSRVVYQLHYQFGIYLFAFNPQYTIAVVQIHIDTPMRKLLQQPGNYTRYMLLFNICFKNFYHG